MRRTFYLCVMYGGQFQFQRKKNKTRSSLANAAALKDGNACSTKSGCIQFQAALIEELLEENYNFLLIPRLQSDALERRFGLYRQIISARFLVSTK